MASTVVNIPGVAVQEIPEVQHSVSWQEFEQQYLGREDAFRYEWVRGAVVKTPRAMNQYQYFILDNLTEFFNRLRMENKASGKLYAEIDTFFQKNVHRRPDLAWFSDEQVARMARRENQVPKFVIEIISENDVVDKLLDKLKDYHDAQVGVVWLISPSLEQVHIFAAGVSMICTGDMLCSAAPVLPGFEISANAIFEKPTLPEVG